MLQDHRRVCLDLLAPLLWSGSRSKDLLLWPASNSGMSVGQLRIEIIYPLKHYRARQTVMELMHKVCQLVPLSEHKRFEKLIFVSINVVTLCAVRICNKWLHGDGGEREREKESRF